ncbi:Transcriptional adapter ADA2b [Zea mays]|uniref:Transcriptional adapter ADA2b n=1 Tax=Zea mays TaxID=4577 RepID=A0A1D6L4P4_MAIZE|nr:Transcriptional adapter ADA2b [Zea mays]
MKKASAASRYAAYDSPSPSPSSRRAAPSAAAATPGGAHGSSRALVVAGRSGRDLLGAKPQPQAHGNLGSVLRRLISMDKKPPKNQLPVPPAAASAAKNNGGGKLPGLSRKLFQKASSTAAAAPRKTKALTEVKNSGNNANTRTLAMVLRTERELLAQTKAQEDEIAALRLQLENKDREVERLKDLCLRQREEIRTLKDAVLFPDAEPEPDRRLRDEISTLTDQIQCLAQELTQVKAEKHSTRSCFDEDGYCSSPRTPGFNEETAFSLECSIGEAETPNYGSPDEMFSKDLNPCLTPCIAKSKSDVSAQFQSSSQFTKVNFFLMSFVGLKPREA